jgi:hypothetical protein
MLTAVGCGAVPSPHGSSAAAGAPRPTASASPATADQLKGGRWTTLPPSPIPPRNGASVVWTGRELLVWGGGSGAQGDRLHADGAAYDPSTGRWRTLPGAPLSPRVGQAAVWTGREMVVWGGEDQTASAPVHVVGDGAAFDPVHDSWQHIAAPTAPQGHPLSWRAAVRAGDQLLAWSEWATTRPTGPSSSTTGGGVDLFLSSGAAEAWRSVAAAPDMLPDVEEVLWTGRSMVVRGSTYNCGACPGPAVPEATDLYDPVRNAWTRLPADPVAGMGGQLVSAWTGRALFSLDPTSVSGTVQPGDASVYDPDTERWSRLARAPVGCGDGQAPVWTGRQLLLYCPHSANGEGMGRAGLVYTVSP